jgi:hypothetical protein
MSVIRDFYTERVAPALEPPAPKADPFLDILNAVFDEAVALAPGDWLDRQIRKAQGIVVAKWSVIGPAIHAEFKTIPTKLHLLVDGALRAASLALAGRPLAYAVLNIVRGILDAVWEDIFPAVADKLAAKGVKVGVES